MEEDWLYIVGPGTTTRTIMQRLGLQKTLLGVDVVEGKKMVANDLNEAQLIRIVDGKKAKILDLW